MKQNILGLVVLLVATKLLRPAAIYLAVDLDLAAESSAK